MCASRTAFNSLALALVAAKEAAAGSSNCLISIMSAGLVPSMRATVAAMESGLAAVRKVPRPTWRTTVPSSSSKPTARRTVLRATPNSLARSRSGGIRPFSIHSPSEIRFFKAMAMSLATSLGMFGSVYLIQ